MSILFGWNVGCKVNEKRSWGYSVWFFFCCLYYLVGVVYLFVGFLQFVDEGKVFKQCVDVEVVYGCVVQVGLVVFYVQCEFVLVYVFGEWFVFFIMLVVFVEDVVEKVYYQVVLVVGLEDVVGVVFL